MTSQHLFDVAGKVFIVTGGAGLLGTRYTRALAEAGAHVIVADIDEQAACAVVAQTDGAAALPVQVDVADPASVRALIKRVEQHFGRIDGLVNNAALDPKFDPEHATEHTEAFEDYPLEAWNKALDVNLTGMFLCAQAVAPALLRQGTGVIVNISSMYGAVGPDQRLYESDDPNAPVTYKPVTYSVTKSAVYGFTRYLATYWAGRGIRVNTLTLGGVFNDHDEAFLRRYAWRTPLGRMADKDEYCGALLFLLSEASSYMTGANLVVDGGWTAW